MAIVLVKSQGKKIYISSGDQNQKHIETEMFNQWIVKNTLWKISSFQGHNFIRSTIAEEHKWDLSSPDLNRWSELKDIITPKTLIPNLCIWKKNKAVQLDGPSHIKTCVGANADPLWETTWKKLHFRKLCQTPCDSPQLEHPLHYPLAKGTLLPFLLTGW